MLINLTRNFQLYQNRSVSIYYKNNSNDILFLQNNFLQHKNADSVSFSSRKIGKYAVFNLKDFTKNINALYPRKNVNEVLHSVMSEPKNVLGKGNFGTVYQIPKINKYVIKLFHKNTVNSDKIVLKNVNDEFLRTNFGQAIAKSKTGDVLILKKLDGVEHGIKDRMPKAFMAKEITVEDSLWAYKQFEKLSTLPQKSFDDFAQKVKMLNKSDKYFVDFLNPNNVLVDYKKNKINFTDLVDLSFDFPWHKPYPDDASSITYSILDGMCYTRLLEAVPDNLKEKFVEVSKKIVQKSIIASKKVGLNIEPPPHSRFDDLEKLAIELNVINEKMCLAKNLNEFTDFYREVLLKP